MEPNMVKIIILVATFDYKGHNIYIRSLDTLFKLWQSNYKSVTLIRFNTKWICSKYTIQYNLMIRANLKNSDFTNCTLTKFVCSRRRMVRRWMQPARIYSTAISTKIFILHSKCFSLICNTSVVLRVI